MHREKKREAKLNVGGGESCSDQCGGKSGSRLRDRNIGFKRDLREGLINPKHI